MTDQHNPGNASPAGAPPPAGALLLSRRPDRLRTVRAAIMDKPGGAQLLSRFEFDVQAFTAVEAAKQLRAGLGDGRWHSLLLIDGDMASSMTPRDLEQLRAASYNRDRLLLLGVVDTPADAAPLLTLGLERVFKITDDVPTMHSQIKAAVEDAKRLIEERRMEAAKASAPVVIVQQAQPTGEGLLPDRGVITVHATKGGAGKTTVSSNLAYALSRGGAKTVLLDINPEGGIAHAHFWDYLSRGGLDFADYDDMFARGYGLSELGRSMDFDSPSQVIDPEYLKRCLVPVIDDPKTGQNLWMLPGIKDQTEYQAFTTRTAGNRKVAALLANPLWVKQLVEMLTRPPFSFTYVVIDTGINRYTTMGWFALEVADLIFLVADTGNEIDMQVDEDAYRHLIDQIELGRIKPLRRRVLVANKFDPEDIKLSEIIKRFSFLAEEPGRGVEVLPLRFDRQTFKAAQRKGVPALALEEKGRLPADQHPGLADLKTIVNRVRMVFGDAGNKKQSRGGLFGRKK